MDYDEDVLGAPYEQHTFELAPDDEGPVVATLVRRPADAAASRGRGRRAVLHVHGFADYFFQTAAADFWCARGYDFYALDLRKYGRSWREHQTANFVTDLATYDEELDLAYAELAREHDHVVLSAHSTGGLVVPLWLDRRRHPVRGLFLNAPWIDMQGDAITRLMAMPAIHRVGARRPRREIRRKVTGGYARSLHRDHFGEWDFDLAWKPEASFPVYAGWIRAIREGQARVRRGLDLEAPILVVTSSRSSTPERDDDPDLVSTDVVLDVERLRRRAPMLSRHVTVVQVDGALHDVTLSPEPARSRVFDELDRFLSAYVDRADADR